MSRRPLAACSRRRRCSGRSALGLRNDLRRRACARRRSRNTPRNYNADVAAYRQTVLTAFQQVEDYIATVRVLSQQIYHASNTAVEAAQRYLEIATSRYQTGLDPYLNVIPRNYPAERSADRGDAARERDDRCGSTHPGARRRLERNPAPCSFENQIQRDRAASAGNSLTPAGRWGVPKQIGLDCR